MVCEEISNTEEFFREPSEEPLKFLWRAVSRTLNTEDQLVLPESLSSFEQNCKVFASPMTGAAVFRTNSSVSFRHLDLS